MTTPQLQTLRDYINGDAGLSQIPHTPDGNADTAALLNAPASPEYWRLKTALAQAELQNQPSVDATNFDWASPGGFIARSQGERDAYRTMFAAGSVNPSFATIRSAIDDIFSGTGAGAVANRTHWRAAQRVRATTFEQLYTRQTVGGPSQPGNRGTTTNPDTLALDANGNYLTGPVTADEVADALAS